MTHLRLLHASTRLTLAQLRERYWIVRARQLVRSVIHKCVRCTRERALSPEQLMGNLPDYRVTRTARPFVHTGVDYAGPMTVRSTIGCGSKNHKVYIAIFICMNTKAIHIELVSDYSSNAFLAAYQRFVARRGIPTAMYSDNGTNFKGADREMAKAYRAATRDSIIANYLSNYGTTWHFIPPSAPHFGGLWEAAVRSMKHHLRRCIGIQTLTYEEMTTLLCRIEACLNSRPLGAVSDHIDDYTYLTPGHFMIGSETVSPPEPSVLDLRENRLSRWQIIQQITEKVWREWQRDYLHTLHHRSKWRTHHRQVEIGRLVLIKESNSPPSHWSMGRITACHPGSDGLTRVVTVRTQNSEFKRPLTKLCLLPIDINSKHETQTAHGGRRLIAILAYFLYIVIVLYNIVSIDY